MDSSQSPRRYYDAPPIEFDILNLFRERLGENSKLHARYINPAWVKSLQLIGYDRIFTRAEGCYLWDKDGRRYPDCVSNVGHNHPVVRVEGSPLAPSKDQQLAA